MSVCQSETGCVVVRSGLLAWFSASQLGQKRPVVCGRTRVIPANAGIHFFAGFTSAFAGTHFNPSLARKNRGMEEIPAVYILASRPFGTSYIGVTSDLVSRSWQHRNGQGSAFTSGYGVKTLVYFELHESMENAIVREKRLKAWKRRWKVDLIEQGNPEWKDLWPTLSE